MTDEELEALIKEVSEQNEQLPDESEKPLNKDERRQKLMLRLKGDALDKIKKAKEKGNLNQEVKACLDYSLLVQYGEKHPFLLNFIKSQMTGFWF